MLRHHAPKAARVGSILSNVWFTMSDTRMNPLKFKDTNGVMFICSFGMWHFLIGCNGKLWRMNSRGKGYRRDWPLVSVPTLLSTEILWLAVNREYPFEFTGLFSLYEKKGKSYSVIHQGHLENLDHLLIKLQRWTRRMQKRARALALSMALHPRLGAKSWLSGLEDIFPLILRSQA
jgi:hypothetical protein